MFFIGAQPLIRLVTQPPFWDAYVSVGPSAAAQFLIGLHAILLAGMYLTKQVRLAAVIQGAAAVVSIALNLLLIPAFGALGAALGLVGGFVALVVVQHGWNVTRLQYRVPFDRRLIVYAGVYVAVAALFLWDRDAPLAVELVLSALGAAGMVAVVFMLLTPAERAFALSQISLRLGRASG
jgi:O-antigen/teichoic acid export membrane protein